MSAIDWTPYDKWSEDTVTCRCGTTFRSHAKATFDDGKPAITSRKPCPTCGATSGHVKAQGELRRRDHDHWGPLMRRTIDKVRIAGTAVVIVASVLLPWAWTEAKRARRERQPPPPQSAAAT
jgi:hypothetical protein